MANAKWASTFVFVSHITGILGAWLLRFDFRIRNMEISLFIPSRYSQGLPMKSVHLEKRKTT
uniref:Uncharacterized protein n=1 Tax=Coccidioides posadasii RMSCC 3488 TaxID=454284 RepID=A0A0J6FGS3_COCPO|nr:hypothetical protein CPAG_04871 [Coccidioides posadasii RMSCC 3488]